MASTSGVVRDMAFKKGVLTSGFFFKQTTTTKSCLKHTKANERVGKKNIYIKRNPHQIKCYT